MPPHALGSGTISFGLVSIPIRLYTTTASGHVSFNLLHARCGSRIQQRYFCPTCQETVERGSLVRGYEFAKDQYVRVTDEELRALEGEASKIIDIAEFLPLPRVDPIFFDKAYYLGADKGGEKAYRLLADAMAKTNRVAVAKFVMRGKESLVLIRPAQGGLMLHTMYFADEVRAFEGIDRGQSAKVKDGELDLAVRLIEDLSEDDFNPGQYQDDHRLRVQELIQAKVDGQEVTAAEPQAHRAQVIDLMAALKESLAERGVAESLGPVDKKPPVKAPRRAAASRVHAATAKRAQASRK
jgi:DNA end-binding protein Ku